MRRCRRVQALTNKVGSSTRSFLSAGIPGCTLFTEISVFVFIQPARLLTQGCTRSLASPSRSQLRNMNIDFIPESAEYMASAMEQAPTSFFDNLISLPWYKSSASPLPLGDWCGNGAWLETHYAPWQRAPSMTILFISRLLMERGIDTPSPGLKDRL